MINPKKLSDILNKWDYCLSFYIELIFNDCKISWIVEFVDSQKNKQKQISGRHEQKCSSLVNAERATPTKDMQIRK